MPRSDESDYTHDLKKILSPQFTVTKRQLGIVLAIVGALAFLLILSIDLIGGGREGGIGPTQQIALLGSGIVFLVGLSLIPLGDLPA